MIIPWNNPAFGVCMQCLKRGFCSPPKKHRESGSCWGDGVYRKPNRRWQWCAIARNLKTSKIRRAQDRIDQGGRKPHRFWAGIKFKMSLLFYTWDLKQCNLGVLNQKLSQASLFVTFSCCITFLGILRIFRLPRHASDYWTGSGVFPNSTLYAANCSPKRKLGRGKRRSRKTFL